MLYARPALTFLAPLHPVTDPGAVGPIPRLVGAAELARRDAAAAERRLLRALRGASAVPCANPRVGRCPHCAERLAELHDDVHVVTLDGRVYCGARCAGGGPVDVEEP